MRVFTQLLKSSHSFRELTDALQSGKTPISLQGAADIHKAHFAAACVDMLQKKALILCKNEVSGRQLCRDINAFLGEEAALFYPERDLSFSLSQTASREYEQERLAALCRFSFGELPILVSSAAAAMQYTVQKDQLKNSFFTLQNGGTLSVDKLTNRLLAGGYTRRTQIDGVGQFSVRGGIVDLYCPTQKWPVRLELWGDEIDSLSYFDPDTQRRTEALNSVTVTPARELFGDVAVLLPKLRALEEKQRGLTRSRSLAQDIALLESGAECCTDKYLPLSESCGSLFDLPAGTLLFVSEYSECLESARGYHERLMLQVSELIDSGELVGLNGNYGLNVSDFSDSIAKAPCVLMDTFSRSLPLISPKKLITLHASQSGLFSQRPSSLPETLSAQLKSGILPLVALPTRHMADILCRDLLRERVTARVISAADQALPEPGCVYLLEAAFSACMEYPEERISLTAFAGATGKKKTGAKKNRAVFDLSSVSVGDYVVHSAHGIGIYKGMQKLEVQGVVKDYIKIQYGGSDVLYVPVTQLDLVAKYIGASSEDTVKLSRLGSASWKNARARVSRAVRDMANELTQLYAKRLQVRGFAFSPDCDWQRDFEERFPYTETPDQIRCIAEIKQDMESPRPMERLLCGDVGFGKTEVALRAAMKCVMDSKQCAILVPTTILAYQHYRTALERFDGFPIQIEMLSGFCTAKQQQEILRRLARGETDIIVGTHRLLQKDVRFRGLGLAIIDEEQRFGVAHKEKFKELYPGVDLLTLSATPIPRTLNMAMAGIRDISMIEEAPQDRYPVQTFVLEYNRRLLHSAIERELARGGQIYYIHNRIESIHQKALELQGALPGCRIEVAHGQMPSHELERVWKRLTEHEIDLLVCTTIIETGVDVANCNTLIIEDADRMGLSQLYQLRGRIGRSSRRAFAYFTFRPGKELSDIASRRLSAIRDFTAFGSGFQIALRDLEIRGAGNMLGAQQHGHMDAVGYDMYLKLLNEAIAEQRGEAPVPEDNECLIDIRVSAHIPNTYIEDNVQRIEVYRHIALIQTDEDAMDVTDELIDRYGDPPREVSLLISVALLRALCKKAGISTITQKTDFAVVEFLHPELSRLSAACAAFPGKVFLSNGKAPYLSVKIKNEKDVLADLTDLASLLSEKEKNDA